MPKGKPYSEEFKQGAPKLVSEQRLRPSQVARGLGSLSTRNSASKSASGSFLLYQFVSAPPNGLFVIGRGAHVRYRTLSITRQKRTQASMIVIGHEAAMLSSSGGGASGA